MTDTKKTPLNVYLRRTNGEAPETGDEPVLLRLGRNVRRLRELHGMSQADLAEKCGERSQVWVSKLERGTRDIHVTGLAALAKALKTTPGALVEGRWPSDRRKEAKASLLRRLRQIDPTVELAATIHDEFEITCSADRRERVLAFMREWRWPDA